MDNILEQAKVDKMIYALAKEYLLSINGVTLEIYVAQNTVDFGCKKERDNG